MCFSICTQRETGLSVEDRVAFACLFLNDMQIYSYVEELMGQAVLDGDLEGILLTGLTKDGVTLLQAYVDRVSMSVFLYNFSLKGQGIGSHHPLASMHDIRVQCLKSTKFILIQVIGIILNS